MSISVCIATYNGEKFIEEQILSIMNQLNGDWEIIICDDNSDDDTVKILEKFQNPKIKVYRNSKRLGYTLNFEKAIQLATKKYIFLSDQDDIWTKDKIKVTTQCLRKNDLVISNAKLINQDGKIIHPSYFRLRKSKNGFLRNLIRPGYLGCTLAFNRKVLNFIIPFPKKGGKHEIPHDYWVGLSGLLFFKTKWIEKPLILYRRHENNISNGGLRKSNNTFTTIIRLRYVAIKHLIKRRIFFSKNEISRDSKIKGLRPE